MRFNLLSLIVLILTATSCTSNKRFLHAPYTPTAPMFHKKGDAMVTGNVSTPFDAQDEDVIVSKSIDAQAAYAFANNWALSAAYSRGWEEAIQTNTYSLPNKDSLFYTRNRYELGVGFFTFDKNNPKVTYNLYAGILVGNNTINEPTATTDSYFKLNYLGWYLQPSIHVFFDRQLRLALVCRASTFYAQNINTNYSDNARKEFKLLPYKPWFGVIESTATLQYAHPSVPKLAVNISYGTSGTFKRLGNVEIRNGLVSFGLSYYPFSKKKKPWEVF